MNRRLRLAPPIRSHSLCRDPRPGAMVALLLLAGSPATAEPSTLQVVKSGTSPGMLSLRVDGATPHATVRIYRELSPQTSSSSHVAEAIRDCPDGVLRLREPYALYKTVETDDEGAYSSQISSVEPIGSTLYQAVESSTCRGSNTWRLISGFATPPAVTGQTVSYSDYDDGALQKGVGVPSQRFEVNGDGTVTDNLTGLVWLRDADCFGSQLTWYEALEAVQRIGSYPDCGLDEQRRHRWRMPNVNELRSLVSYDRNLPALPDDHPFLNVRIGESYWTSTTVQQDTDKAWVVSFVFGSVFVPDAYDEPQDLGKYEPRYLLAVRN